MDKLEDTSWSFLAKNKCILRWYCIKYIMLLPGEKFFIVCGMHFVLGSIKILLIS